MEEALDSVLPQKKTIGIRKVETTQETAWVRASQRGDVIAFNRLVLMWEKQIYNLTFRLLQDPDEAAESTQEVFLNAFKNIRRFRCEAQFSTWLYRIASNTCMSRLRKRPPGVHISLEDLSSGARISQVLPAVDSHEREFLQEESHQRVRKALEHLQPEQKIVLELKFYQELTFEEIAQIVDAPLSTIKSRLYTGLETLKVRLGRMSRKR